MSAISFAMTKVLLGVAAWDEPMHSINAVVILRRIFLILFTATSIGACIDCLFFYSPPEKRGKRQNTTTNSAAGVAFWAV
jgi:hypothetical protein